MSIISKILMVGAVAMSISSIGCGQPEKKADAVETTSINVRTIQCSMCVATITKTMQGVDGVTSASVDLEKKIATVQFLPAKVTVANLEMAIANAGYNANDVKRNDEAYENLPGCCKEE